MGIGTCCHFTLAGAFKGIAEVSYGGVGSFGHAVARLVLGFKTPTLQVYL